MKESVGESVCECVWERVCVKESVWERVCVSVCERECERSRMKD